MRKRPRLAAGLLALAAGAAAAQATPERDDVEDFFSKPLWKEVIDKVQADSLHPATEASLRTACYAVLLEPKPAGGIDFCLSVALSGLDDESGYIPAAELARRKAAARPAGYIGIGVELGQRATGEALLITRPVRGSSSDRGGVLPGDRVTHVDGVDIRPLTMDDIVTKHLRGPEGSWVVLQIERGPAHEPLSIKLRREPVRFVRVCIEAREDEVAVLQIRALDAESVDDFRAQLESLLRGGKPPAVLLVDLRGDRYGSMDAAIQIAEAFGGGQTPVASLRDREGKHELTVADTQLPHPEFSAPIRDALAHARIAVLVNGGTLGTAELVALALRERRQAVIYGQRTYGYSKKTTNLPLSNGASLRLVTGEMLSGQGTRWGGRVGIAPDQPLSDDKKDNFGEADDVALHRLVQSLRKP